jgi:hypothetical protein
MFYDKVKEKLKSNKIIIIIIIIIIIKKDVILPIKK